MSDASPARDDHNTDVVLHGLSTTEVLANRARYGANLLTPPARDPWWKLYLEKFKDPIIRILCVAAVVALAVGLYDDHFIEGVGIVIAILLATGISFFNEYRAAKEFDILNQASDDEPVSVIRNSRHQSVPKRDIVVGDIVLVEQGGEIPADGEVLESIDLTVNESGLTGESVPANKRPLLTDGDEKAGDDEAEAAYPANLVLRSTMVASGRGTLRVAAVGDATEIGKTARAAAETPNTVTPLSRQLEKLAGVISVGAFMAAVIIFVAQTVRGAFNLDVYDLAEKNGRFIKIPLNGGQWFCFLLLALVVVILCAQVWAPTLRNALAQLGLRKYYPDRLDALIDGSFLRLAGIAVGVGVVGVILAALVGAISLTSGTWLPVTALGAFLRYFMLAVTVIVVAVPEGLPMCVTLALAYSMRKMTASNNLVRKMHACETIGAASVILSDKTGTLTMNEMRVHRPCFVFLREDKLSIGERRDDLLVEAICANSSANLEKSEEGCSVLGNPTEGALLMWLEGAGVDYDIPRRAFKIRHQLPFSTEWKFMATTGRSAVTGEPVIYLKGAAEIVLARCGLVRNADGGASPLDGKAKEDIIVEAARFQNRGMRIIGFASGPSDPDHIDIREEVNQGGLVWDGFIAISDPIRPNAPAAIAAAIGAGVKVKIVTGDNQTTAKEIAKQAGLWQAGDSTRDSIITGDAFEALDLDAAGEAASRIKVMSRARPLHKQRLVKLLQGRGEVVAVTGDGTNDAPALNHADVGLAMGKTGTSVAKEASDIILLDDSFQSIVNAIAWGRSLYANIQKFVVFQLIINVAAVGIALLGPFLGVTLPLTVVQMLWINLIMDTFAALALASEPPDWGLMNNSPRPSGAFIVTPAMTRTILITGGVFLCLFLALLLGFGRVFPMDAETPLGRHNLTLFFTGFVLLQFWNLFNARVFGTDHSAFHRLGESRTFLLMAGVILVGQFLLVELGGSMFRVVPLSLAEWVALLVVTSPVLWVGEFLRYDKRLKKTPGYWVYS